MGLRHMYVKSIPRKKNANTVYEYKCKYGEVFLRKRTCGIQRLKPYSDKPVRSSSNNDLYGEEVLWEGWGVPNIGELFSQVPIFDREQQ